MQFNFNKLPKSQVECTVEITAEEFNKFFDKAILSLGKEIEIKGFRKGRAPKEVLEKNLDSRNILEKAAQIAAEETSFKIISESEFEPVSQPEITILKLAQNNPFSYKAKFWIIPSISLPGYKQIASSFVKEPVSVSGEEVDEVVRQIQKSRATLTSLSRPAGKGDFVEIDYSFQIEGEKRTENFKDGFLLGEGRIVQGFEEKIVGMEKGAKKEFSLIFPENHPQKALAQKKADFEVKLLEVKKMELPELSDEFAQSLGKFQTLFDLRQNIKEGIRQEKEIAENDKRKSQIIAKIEKECSFEAPEILVAWEKEKLYKDLEERVQKLYKISLEEYLGKIKKSKEDINKELSATALKKVKNFLILREIGKKEQVSVSEEELTERINQFLKNHPSEEKARKELDLGELKDYYRTTIFIEKVLEKLLNFLG